MTPIFGEGVVFDASPERRREMLHNQALRGDMMRGPRRRPSPTRSTQMVAGWADEGEIDLLDFFAELTIYTSSACLIGAKFRNELDRRFAELLPRAGARHRPARATSTRMRPIESFRRRDEARAGLGALVGQIMAARGGRSADATRRPRPARRADVDHATRTATCAFSRRRGHRHVHLDDVRRAPHQLRHGGVDADRAAAASRGAGGGASAELDELYADGAGGRASRRCARSRGSSPPSRRRCGCTRR